jgi:hypothetical protein
VPVPQSCISGRRCGVPHADKPLAVRDTSPIPPRSHPLGGGGISSDTAASTRRACITVWGATRERVVYTMGILVPLVALALVAALGGESSQRVSELPNGGILEWIFPRSAIREVVVYTGVVLWLLREIRRRTPDDFRRTLWRAPASVAIANVLLAAPFVLVHGSVRELLAEQAGWIGLRFLVRILVGCGYVALVEWIQGQLRRDDVLGLGNDVSSSCRHRPAHESSSA